MWIAPSRHETWRFIQDDVQRLVDVHKFAADFDVITCRRLCAEISADAAVDCDAPGSDQRVTLAS